MKILSLGPQGSGKKRKAEELIAGKNTSWYNATTEAQWPYEGLENAIVIEEVIDYSFALSALGVGWSGAAGRPVDIIVVSDNLKPELFRNIPDMQKIQL